MIMPAAASAPEVVLDISRILSRVHHHTPTGVDRVEMAYARGLLEAIPDRVRIGAVHPSRIYGRRSLDKVRRFLDEVERSWDQGSREISSAALWCHRAAVAIRMRPEPVPQGGGPRIYVQSSPHHLDREPLVRDILRREHASALFLVHDLIPIEFPEYVASGGRDAHLRRVDTVVRHASAVITNSAATRRSLLPYLGDAGRSIPVEVAHLGLDLHRTDVSARTPRGSERPYFVCIGTIEPRKNHLLLLHLWRAMSERHGAAAIPKLVVIGRRGWENEQIIDMLDRCPALHGCVEERNGLPDDEMRDLLVGARALLLPSFAEGYGMPVSEALSLGVPVICSDLPALREAGQNIPDYLDPLDGPGWWRAIEDFASDGPMLRSQRSRMANWRDPQWSDHITILLTTIDRLSSDLARR